MTRETSRAKRPWAAAAVALLGVVLAVAVLVEARARADRTEEVRAAQVAARAVLPVSAAIEELRDEAERAAAAGGRDVGVDDPDGPSSAVAAQARDTGRAVVDDAYGGVVVVARYEPTAPTSVAERRAGLVGFTLIPLDLQRTLAAQSGALEVLGPDHRVAGAPAKDGASFVVHLDDTVAPGWTLRATSAATGLPVAAWLAALAVLLAGLAASAVVLRSGARTRRRRADARRRVEADSVLAELASVAQSSLDLAEVLPASFALLEEALDLDGLALVGGATRTTFVWRDAPTDDEPMLPARAPIAAGSCVDVPLVRSGRSLGSLRIRPRRALDEGDLRTLATAAETLSSSIANADAFDHQRALVTRMRKLDDLKTVFVATASHELRTPVAAVIGYASMLTDSWHDLDSATGLLYAQRVESNAQRLVALVEDLLDFARLEQGRAQGGEKVPLDLGVEVRSLIDSQPALTPNHELLVSVQEGLIVAGSRMAIERVVDNLVGNAAKYSPAGTTIRVRVEQGADDARLIVDDQGPGIPAEEREQIFSRFFRGAGDAVTRTQGAGLGLAIVTEFATFMGGSVSIESAPGGGTRFAVTYPLDHHEALVPAPEQGDAHVPA